MLSVTEPPGAPHFAGGSHLQYRFLFKSTCRPTVTLQLKDESNNYTNLDWYRINKKRIYRTNIRHESGDDYSVTLVIDPLTTLYAGTYRCFVDDPEGNELDQEFSVFGMFNFTQCRIQDSYNYVSFIFSYTEYCSYT